MLPRTQDEIVAKIKAINESGEDFFGAMGSDLVAYLDYEHAKEFISESVIEEAWNQSNPGNPIDDLKGYMEFAWGKARGHRGLSASRSVQHMQAWLWLAGDDELLAFTQDPNNYAMYGVPILAKICEKYEIPFLNDERFQNMSKGLPCTPYCREGCNS